jgi:release factor glutamine methyltransferase
MRVAEALEAAGKVLDACGIEQPRREARLLAAHLLGLPPASLPDPSAQLDGETLLHLARRRAAHEPLAYLTGRRGFWTLDLRVTRDTLIPRPDSETVVEAALGLFPERRRVSRILDLGTGSGCLLLATLAEFPAAFGVGVDISAAAAAVAGGNARACALACRAAFAVSDWGASVAGRFDLVLANPPYVRSADIALLMEEVGRHEPHLALDGGTDGLDAYRRLVPTLPSLLAAGGAAILELGAGQAVAVAGLAQRSGLDHIEVRRDLAGVERAIILSRADDRVPA